VQATHIALSQTWPCWQSRFDWHAGVHVPEAQASPVAQSALTEHEQ
jgi:hypothetical protein